MSWGPLGWIGSQAGKAGHIVGPSGPLAPRLGDLGDAAAHAGKAAGDAVIASPGHSWLWGAGGHAPSAGGAFAPGAPLSHVPGGHAAAGAIKGGAAATHGGWGIISSVLHMGWKGLVLGGAAVLAAAVAVGGLLARLSPTNMARKVALRARSRSVGQSSRSRGAHRAHAPTVIVSGGGGGGLVNGLVKVGVLTMLVVVLTPYTMEQLVNDGRRIMPGSYAGGAGIQTAAASCGMAERGGYVRLASDAGGALHRAAEGTINPAAWATSFANAGRSLGHFIGAFKMSAETGTGLAPVATPVPLTPAQQVAASCCSTAPGLPAGGVPASYTSNPGDSAAMTAARAAQAAGWSGSELVMAVAVAGAESGWNPLAQNPSSSAKGLWQIMMSLHSDKFGGASWTDPMANARVAKLIYDQAAGWSPWSVYTSGSYQAKMTEAATAVAAIGGTAAPTTVPVASCATPSSAGAPIPASFDAQGNPHTVEQAIAWYEGMVASGQSVPEGRCDHYAGEAFGYSSSGSVTARAHWEAIPAGLKHVGADGVPPRGALVFWSTSAAGHVATSDGIGGVYTTGAGNGVHITHETLARVDGWGARLGWSAPYFPGHHGTGA